MIHKVLIPLALVGGLIACGAHHFHGASPCEHFGMVAARLKLSEEQKQGIHQVIERHRPALAERTEALVQARDAALDKGMDPTISAEAWQPAQDAFLDSARELAKEVRATYLEALPLLSESQKSEGRALLSQLHAHAEERHGVYHEMAHRLVKRRLDLTNAQETAIQATLEAHRPALKAKAEALRQLHASALDAALDPASSQELLDRNFGAIRTAALALGSEVRATYLQAQVQLSPEQRGKAKDLVKDFRNALDGVRKLLVGF